MTKSERKVWRQSIRGLRMKYQMNLTIIEGLEKKNEEIMQDVFSRIDQFEKDCEAKNNF